MFQWMLVSGSLYDEKPGASVLSDMIIERVRVEQRNREESPLSDLVSLNSNQSSSAADDVHHMLAELLSASLNSEESEDEVPYDGESSDDTLLSHQIDTVDPRCVQRCYLCYAADEIGEPEANECIGRCVINSSVLTTCPSYPSQQFSEEY